MPIMPNCRRRCKRKSNLKLHLFLARAVLVDFLADRLRGGIVPVKVLDGSPSLSGLVLWKLAGSLQSLANGGPTLVRRRHLLAQSRQTLFGQSHPALLGLNALKAGDEVLPGSLGGGQVPFLPQAFALEIEALGLTRGAAGRARLPLRLGVF